jgi:hypothetical protein
MILAARYQPRQVTPRGVWAHDGWRIKTYTIHHDASPIEPALEATAFAAARRTLPTPAAGEGRYGVGFLGIHQGRGANMVFVDWWADENELHHHAWVSTPEAPGDLAAVTGWGLLGCVWDLVVIHSERDAWVDAVLANPAGPDLAGYLDRLFEGPA